MKGQVSIQGAKNAALPLLAACVLFEEEVCLTNIPNIADVQSMLETLSYMGASYEYEKGAIRIQCRRVQNKRITDELSEKQRASSLLMGGFIGRFGEFEIALPGGCDIGKRPLDLHYHAFEELGADVYVENGLIRAKAQKGYIEGEHEFPSISVGATENLILASVLGKEKVILKNIAIEPEIFDLIRFLNKAGAKISTIGEKTVLIEGVAKLRSIEYTVSPDRIEAATLLFAGFATKGKVRLTGVHPHDLGYVLNLLDNMGAKLEIERTFITLEHVGKMRGMDVKTHVFPGFPTDMQPQISVLLTQADSPSTVIETIFEKRFGHFDELKKMGADCHIDGQMAIIRPSSLTGAQVEGQDLRGAAAMIMAGMCAEGTTRVDKLGHLYRGYEAYIEKLKHLGADICYL